MGPLLALIGLLLLGCTATGPPHSVSSAVGPVRADSPALAAEVAAAAGEGRAELANWLPDLRQNAIEIWVQQALEVEGTFAVREQDGGLTFTRGERVRIYLRTDAYEEVLVHELVHALLDSSWDALPPALEEGLCELASLRTGVHPERRRGLLRAAGRTGPAPTRLEWSVRRGHRRPRTGWTSWTPSGGADGSRARLSVSEVLAHDELRSLAGDEADHVYGVGYVCAERIVERAGVEGLLALCVQASAAGHDVVPVEWVMDAAGFESGSELGAWAMGELTLERIRSTIALDSFWQTIDRLRDSSEGRGLSLGEFVDLFRLEIVAGLAAPLALRELPEFMDRAADHWEDG